MVGVHSVPDHTPAAGFQNNLNGGIARDSADKVSTDMHI
ncbi:hypothetical protein SAMN05421505_112124 [Sinosporangium album]|uniref:Uncharacterized protein n=1 Tax=Sinosporangium album TaxID=504805 RepID=A0A1G8AGE2_9ACTN|nr:hypothetical protein SAMN05421505_112124 [Sinosporangium album]